MSNLTQFYQSGQGAFNTCDVFYESGTWTPPPGVTRAMVLVWGGGGSGAVYNGGSLSNGGAGGGFAQGLVQVTPGTGYSVTIGAGGNYVNSSATNGYSDGNAGGTSSFSTLLTATGGAGGRQVNSTFATASGGSGSSSGALWSFTASGGSTNRDYLFGGGGAASGSPYGVGGSLTQGFVNGYGLGGCGWGINGSVFPSNIPAADFSTIIVDANGTGGSGLMGSAQGFGTGGGGSNNRARSNMVFSPYAYSTFTQWYGSGSQQYNVAEANPGGGQTSVPSYSYTFGTSGPIDTSSTSSGVQSVQGTFFDIVRKTLKGAGGHGWLVNPSNLYMIEAANPFKPGDGGDGSGGGGLNIGGLTTSTRGNICGSGGSGGIGGGGGGVSTFYITGAAQGGYGGMGGGGGGCFFGNTSNTGNFLAQGGNGGVAGGGGGGASNVRGGSGYGNARGGKGGDGCVLVFYRAT